MRENSVEGISSLDDLKAFLISGGIDLSLWGIGEAKSIEDLYREISNGETELFYDEDETSFDRLLSLDVISIMNCPRVKL